MKAFSAHTQSRGGRVPGAAGLSLVKSRLASKWQVTPVSIQMAGDCVFGERRPPSKKTTPPVKKNDTGCSFVTPGVSTNRVQYCSIFLLGPEALLSEAASTYLISSCLVYGLARGAPRGLFIGGSFERGSLGKPRAIVS